MIETARRPSINEIEQLTQQTRQNPGSPAFVALAQAYLALRRPKDAVDVALSGLQADPQSIAGRLVLGQAYAMLHYWKEAQTELLKLVKADRNHAEGFLLLGEVLLRREDYERALPVLQHAQNLAPGATGLDSMLKRARTGIPLDPAEPLQPPLEPLPAASAASKPLPGESTRVAPVPPAVSGNPAAAAGPGMYASAAPSAPTVALSTPGLAADAHPNHPPQVAPGHPGYPAPHAAPPPMPPPAAPQPGGAFPGAPPAAPPPSSAQPGAPNPQPGPGPLGGKTISPGAIPPPPAAPAGAANPPPAAAPDGQHPAPAAAKPTGAGPAEAPPPGPPAGVRPRLPPMQKPRDAARQPLRDVAAIGDYLNALLTEGLLDVPDVKAQVPSYSTAAAKRWGRSHIRTYVFLFVTMFITLGGIGSWYYIREEERAKEVIALLAKARELMTTATFQDLQDALERTELALKRDPSNLPATAVYARAGSLLTLSYGARSDRLDLALSVARSQIGTEHESWPDVLFAESALTLATLHESETPDSQLTTTRANIDKWLDANPDDLWMHWLRGHAMLGISDRQGAASAFETAEAKGTGPVLATIARADMMLDDGDLEGAFARYEAVLQRADKHPLGILGRVFVQLVRSGEPADILGDLNVQLADELGQRGNAYKALAFASIYHAIEDYEQLTENLDKATGITEPRFLARVALIQLLLGQISTAVDTRAKIVWYSDKPAAPHPMVTLLDAELLLAAGLPERSLDKLGDLGGVQGQFVRGRALYDLGRSREALAELKAVLEVAPEDWQAKIWHNAAIMVSNRGRVRRKAEDELTELGRKLKSKMVRYAHGNASQRLGRQDARRRLEQSINGLSDARPNHLAYRAYTELAELYYRDDNADKAVAQLQKALAQNPGYLPANGLLGRIQVNRSQYKRAVDNLEPLVKESEAATAAIELAYAEALVGRGKVNKQTRTTARQAVLRAKEKGANDEDLARVARKVDGKLLDELGLE